MSGWDFVSKMRGQAYAPAAAKAKQHAMKKMPMTSRDRLMLCRTYPPEFGQLEDEQAQVDGENRQWLLGGDFIDPPPTWQT